MRRWLLLTAICLSACSDDPAEPADAGLVDAGATDLGAVDAGSTDLGADAGATDLGATDLGATDLGATDLGAADAGPFAACLESPNELPRPPTDRLPCDLLPPSF